MLVESVPIDSLIAYERNNLKHPQAQVDRLANSIAEFGFNVPIVVNEQNVIIAGHGRLLAARKLGMAEIPVVRKDNLTPAQERAYRLIDNSVPRQAEWDFDALVVEFDVLKDDGLDFKEWGLDSHFPSVADHVLNTAPPSDELSAQAPTERASQFLVLVECENEAKQRELYDEFEERGLKCRIIT